MHELSITQSMFDLVIEQAKKANTTRVTAVNLIIGEITGVVPESVQFYFDFMSKSSIAEGAKLNITMVPCQVRCQSCHHVSQLDNSEFVCPDCKNHKLDIIAGEELFVDSIEVE